MPTVPTITEAAFTAQVLQLAKLYKWRTAHFRPGRTARGWRTAVQGDGAGFPDIILIRRQTILVAELKVGKGKLSDAQTEWLLAFDGAGVHARVWKPEDWQAIEELLKTA